MSAMDVLRMMEPGDSVVFNQEYFFQLLKWGGDFELEPLCEVEGTARITLQVPNPRSFIGVDGVYKFLPHAGKKEVIVKRVA